MSSRCIVCSNRKQIASNLNSHLSFHGFPKDEPVRTQWIKFCGRQEHEIYKTNKICSDHFIDDDFIDNRANGGLRWLKNGAIPSIKKKGKRRRDVRATTSFVPVSLTSSLPTSNLTSAEPQGPYLCSDNSPRNSLVNVKVECLVPSNGNGGDLTTTVSNSGLQLFKELPRSLCFDKSPVMNDPDLVGTEGGGSSSVFNNIDHSENATESHPPIRKPSLEYETENCDSLGLTKTPSCTSRTRRYVGDISSSDFQTPTTAKRAFLITKKAVDSQKKIIKSLQDKNRRLLEKLTCLEDLVQHRKKKDLITEQSS